MVDLRQLKPQYVTNEAGEKTAIILPLEVFEERKYSVNPFLLLEHYGIFWSNLL